MARRSTRRSSLVYSRYLLWLRAGRASPSFSHDRTMDADTPKRCATAPTFSASPTFLGCDLVEGLDKDVSTWPSIPGRCANFVAHALLRAPQPPSFWKSFHRYYKAVRWIYPGVNCSARRPRSL